MGWETVNVADVAIDAKPSPIPAGSYTLQLTGAYESKFRPGQIDVKFVVADENEFRGRAVYVELPDPDVQAWSAQLYARIVKNLGATVAPYANPMEELNKLAQNGHSRLTADVFVETFDRKDGSSGSKNKINQRSIRPAA